MPTGEIVVRGRFAAWLDNFWYHYKWHVIGIVAAVLVLAIGIGSVVAREEEDLTLVYAGPTVLSMEELEQISAVVENLLPADFDENGEKHVAWMTYQIYSKEQMQALSAQKDENGRPLRTVDASFNTSEYNTYGNYLLTGETSVYFLDPWLYEELRSADRLMSLSEVLGVVPESAVDEYGVRLGETDLYEAYGVMRLLPADTVICLMKPYKGAPGSRSADEEAYQFECDTFRALVTFANEDERAE